MFHLALRFATIVVVIGGAIQSNAQEARLTRAKLKEIYESKAPETERRRRELSEQLIQGPPNQLTTKEEELEAREAVTWLGESIDYQRAIDQMYCWETNSENEKIWKECVETRFDYTSARFKFFFEYQSARFATGKCLAKSRMLELEVRYPPYSYMTTSPTAHDGKAFIECVKATM